MIIDEIRKNTFRRIGRALSLGYEAVKVIRRKKVERDKLH